MSYNVSVTELWIYPVKSFPGIAVSSITFDQAGPVDDRRWMLVDANGRFISQRATPALALFKVETDHDGYRVTAPDGDAVVLPRANEEGQHLEVSVWKDTFQAREVSAELSAWFTAKLDRTVHLVHTGRVSPRRIPDAATSDDERVGFADGYPLLVCNQSSLDRVNRETGLQLGLNRFRPNLVISDVLADAELELGTLRFGEGQVDLLKTCVRCNIPAIDPATAVYDKSVAAAIKASCQWQGQAVFGVNGVARKLSVVRVGDSAVFGRS